MNKHAFEHAVYPLQRGGYFHTGNLSVLSQIISPRTGESFEDYSGMFVDCKGALARTRKDEGLG